MVAGRWPKSSAAASAQFPLVREQQVNEAPDAIAPNARSDFTFGEEGFALRMQQALKGFGGVHAGEASRAAVGAPGSRLLAPHSPRGSPSD